MREDPVAHGLRQIQPAPVSLEHRDHSQRVLVVPEAKAEALGQAFIERRFADMPERRVPEVVTKTDRLREILVQRESPGDRSRNLGHLERVGEPGAVMVACGQHEHLRLVLQAPEGLAMDDPVTITLKRRAQATVGLLHRSEARV